MEHLEEHLRKDVERIQQLPVIPSILELICRTTGMGFCAVARVTEDKWIACAVKDEINFGLRPGDELQIETTICNEIRGHGQPVIIDEVDKDEQFCNHHTPKQYGFQSYISIPIILKDGTFFGTLCAIDPRPFPLKSSNMVTLFNLFADLISYHLLTQDELRTKSELLLKKDRQLRHSMNEVRQYSHISRHTLQEPLRKIQIFTDQLITLNYLPEEHKAKQLASKLNTLAAGFSTMISELTDFSGLSHSTEEFQIVNLNSILYSVLGMLRLTIDDKKAVIEYEVLHSIEAIPEQMTQLFYHLLSNALTFTRPDSTPVIRIYSQEVDREEVTKVEDLNPDLHYCRVCFEDNGTGIESNQLDKIFDLFMRLEIKEESKGFGMGLSQAKKIVRNHQGMITVQSELEAGSVFSVILPINQQHKALSMGY